MADDESTLAAAGRPPFTWSHAFVRYHRGLGRMPLRWKPWLISLLAANMLVPPWFLIFGPQRWEAALVLGIALIHGAMMVTITARTGFSRLLGLGHILWFPMLVYLGFRLPLHPDDTFYGGWLRTVIVLDAFSLIIDVVSVIRFVRGEREELVEL